MREPEGEIILKDYSRNTDREVRMMSKHRDPKTVMRYDHERYNLKRNPANGLGYDD